VKKVYVGLISIIMLTFNFKGFSNSIEIKLPPHKIDSNISLEQALNERQSVREYKNSPLSLEEISQILWAAYGKNKWNKLTTPSAGALYPLVIYLVVGEIKGLAEGLYKYNNSKHSLLLVSSSDLRLSLSKACLNQRWIRDGMALIVICADYGITTSRYRERGKRYVDIEVGHAGQNVYLEATSLGLGTVAVGAFYDEKVKKILGIEEEPLYIMPLGKVK
jgi:SagB-type dehydrogenase family enzyme